MPGQLTLPAGHDVALPADLLPEGSAGAKFTNPRGLRTADGAKVQAKRVYTRAEILGTRYTGAEAARINHVASPEVERSRT